MIADLKLQLHEACLLMQRCRVSSYSDAVMSAFDRERRIIAVKKTGCDAHLFEFTYDLIPDEFCEHLKIYEIFPSIRSFVHLHSYNVSIFADAGLDFRPYALADKHYFGANIPCVCRDSSRDIASVIADKYMEIGQTPETLPAVLIKSDGALVFGKTPISAADLASILENNAKYAYLEARSSVLSDTGRFDLLNAHNPAKKIKAKLK